MRVGRNRTPDEGIETLSIGCVSGVEGGGVPVCLDVDKKDHEAMGTAVSGEGAALTEKRAVQSEDGEARAIPERCIDDRMLEA